MQTAKTNKSFQKKQKEKLSSLLKKTGFLMPTTEEEVEENESAFGNTDILLPKEVDSPDFIFERLGLKPGNKNVQEKLTTDVNSQDELKKNQNDYFKKLVLAAEIVNQLYEEPTFGHKKFVKVYFVCEKVCVLKLSTSYLQYAAGPLDPKHLYTIEAEFKKKKWFTVTKRKNGYGFEYAPDINVLEYQVYYSRYFKNQIETISNIIELFRKKSSDFCEIVATLLASWLKLLEKNISVDDEILFNEFYAWSKEKIKFKKPQLIKAVEWMRTNEIIPVAPHSI